MIDFDLCRQCGEEPRYKARLIGQNCVALEMRERRARARKGKPAAKRGRPTKERVEEIAKFDRMGTWIGELPKMTWCFDLSKQYASQPLVVSP